MFESAGMKEKAVRFRPAVLLVLLSVTFGVIVLHAVNQNVNPERWDTTSFLGEANTVVHHGGIDGYLIRSFTGKVEQANQHPLYSILLSPLASRDISFFVRAKLVSALLGLLAIICIFLLVRRRHGDAVAGVGALGMILTPTFVYWSGLVATESLLVLLSFLTFYFIVAGFEKNELWWAAGAFAGLGYLTKGTALFLLPAFPLAAYIAQRRRILKNRHFYGFFLMLVVAASPLLVRNTVRFHNPLFNINTHGLTYSSEELAEGAYRVFNTPRGAGIIVYPERQATTGESERRLTVLLQEGGSRLLSELDLLLRTLNVWPLPNIIGRVGQLIFGLVVVGFFLAGLKIESRGPASYVFITVLVFVVALALFRGLPRYLLPAVAMIWVYAAYGVVATAQRIGQTLRWKPASIEAAIQSGVAVACVLLIAHGFASRDLSSPLDSVEYPESRAELLSWLRQNLDEGDVYSEGPNFNWQLPRGTWMIPPRNIRMDIERYTDFAVRYGTDYVVLDTYSLTESRFRGGGIDRQAMLEGYVDVDEEEGLTQIREIPGWRPVYTDPEEPVDFIVYEIIRDTT